MILKTANVSIDVEDYDAVVDKIKSLIENTEGFIESEQMSYRTDFNDRDNLKYGSLVLRVPSGGFESILDDIRSEGNINYDNSYAEDVTKNYRDTASEIENLKITEERLRAILQQATEVEDILNIENELTRVRSQINAYTNQLKNWEDLSDLSYVYLEIVEVESLDPQITKLDDSLWSRAKFGFIETLNQVIVTFEQIVVWLVSKSPILVGLGFITWLLTRAWRKKSKVK
jgi:polyhydroxyalkanoate synthesis regulator phasin